jgi:hypothetical protein
MKLNTKSTLKQPTLDEVLAYQNEEIVWTFSKTFGIPLEESHDIFDEVKRMMWLTNEMEHEGLHERGQRFFIDHSLLVLDEMWHTFILFTKPYADFCMNFFGRFIHHFPTTMSDEKREARRTELRSMGRDEAISHVMAEKRWQYTYVYKKLGEQCFLKWYKEFHRKYTQEHLAELRYRGRGTPASPRSIAPHPYPIIS